MTLKDDISSQLLIGKVLKPKIKTNLANYLYVSIYLAKHCGKVSKKIISVQFLLSLLNFLIQIIFSILLVGLFGGNVEKYLPSFVPAQDIIPSLSASNFGYVVGLFLIIRAVIGFLRRRLDYQLRYKMEVYFSQLFIDLFSVPPVGTQQEIFRRKLRDKGPTIMKMGSHQMAIACTLIARSIVQAPFILVYSILLLVLFQSEILRTSIPLFLAALVSIVLFARLSRLSWAYMDSIKPAVKERSDLWKKMPIRSWDPQMPLNHASNIARGHSGKQLKHFYARHFQSANTSLFVNIFFALSMAIVFIVFANRVAAGETTWSEVIILVAVAQLLLASIGILAGSFLLISRNFAGIHQFIEQCDTLAEPQIEAQNTIERTVKIPPNETRLIILNLGNGRKGMTDIMANVQLAWEKGTASLVAGKDIIRPPFPRHDSDLAKLSQDLGASRILILQSIRFIQKPERMVRVFNILKAENLALICSEKEHFDVFKPISFDRLVITEDAEILDVIDGRSPDLDNKLKKWLDWHLEVNGEAMNINSDLEIEELIEF